MSKLHINSNNNESDAAIPVHLETFQIKDGLKICEPSTFIQVFAGSPALAVMTDFKQVSAATIAMDATLAQANSTMISRGVRLLLVTDAEKQVLGLITSRDTSGEKPIQMARERGGKFSDLLVSDLMCPLEDIDLIDMEAVLSSRVSDIVATLKHFKRQHILAAERDMLSKKVHIRGVFSATQIGRQLGAAIQTFDVGSTFSEIEDLFADKS